MALHIRRRHKNAAENCDVKVGSKKEMKNHLAKTHNNEVNDEDSHMDDDSD